MRRWKCFSQRYRLVRDLDQNEILYTVEKSRKILVGLIHGGYSLLQRLEHHSGVNLKLFLPLWTFFMS